MSKLPVFLPTSPRATLATVVAMAASPQVAPVKVDRDAARVRRGQALARHWAVRVMALFNAGWAINPKRKSYMVHCPPALFVVRGQHTPCGNLAICPHCWARAAIERWREVDYLLFPPAVLPGRRRKKPALAAPRPERVAADVFVRRTIRYDFPFVDAARRPTLPLFLANRLARLVKRKPDMRYPYLTRQQETRWLRLAGAVGGMEQIGVELRPGPRGKPAGWVVLVRQLLVVPRAEHARFLAADRVRRSPGGTVTLRSHEGVTRIRLAALVGGVFRYSRFLLNGPPPAVMAYLTARAKTQLSSRFGTLRLTADAQRAMTKHCAARKAAHRARAADTAADAAALNLTPTTSPCDEELTLRLPEAQDHVPPRQPPGANLTDDATPPPELAAAAPVVMPRHQLAVLPSHAEQLECYLSYIVACRIATLGLGNFVAQFQQGNTPATVLAASRYILDVSCERYPDMLDEPGQIALLDAYVEDLAADPQLSFSAFAAAFFEDEIVRPPIDDAPAEVGAAVEPEPEAEPTPAPAAKRKFGTRPSRAKAQAAVAPPRPGQPSLACAGDPPDEAAADAADRATAAADARAISQLFVAAGKSTRKVRAWEIGTRVEYETGRRHVGGTLTRDAGDGTIEFLPDGKDEKWMVNRSRCTRIKQSGPEPAAAVDNPAVIPR